MIAKFSVKKPYTVLVGVVLVMILGFVSLTYMTADLLPSINLPYAVVYTTYIGASPEEVENTISRPVESSMATISNIENIQSVSAENVSMVILQFAQTANMDSITIDMREKLDQISANWDDTIGNPVIMKLNPDMLPIMIAAFDMEGMDRLELTDYANNTLLAEIESVEGVASASLNGGIEESLQVVLSQELIDAKNEEVRQCINEQFADARAELADSKQQIEDGMDELESGASALAEAQAQIASGQTALAEQIAQAKGQVSTQQMQLLETKLTLTNQLSELNSQLTELTTTESQLTELNNQWKSLKATQLELETAHENYQSLSESYGTALGAVGAYEAQIAAIQLNPELSEEEKAAQIAEIQNSEEYITAKQNLEDVQQQFELLGITPEDIPAKLLENEAAYQSVTLAIQTIETAVSAMGYDINAMDEYLAEIASGKEQLQGGITQIQTTLEMLDSGQIAIQDANVQIAVGEANGNLQLYTALAQTLVGQSTMEMAKSQLESGLTQITDAEEQINSAEEDAMEQADLHGILTRDMVSQILTAQNFSMPAGYISGDGESQMLIRVGDKLEDAEAVKDLVILDLGFDGMEPIRLRDVAQVDFVDNSDEVYASVNGNPGLIFTMQKQTGYSTGDVSNKIQKKFEKLSAENPGLSFTILMDQGIYIDYIVNSVVNNMLVGAVLAVIILAIFLKSIKPTILVAFSIPISLISAIVLMYFSGVTLNVISLSGLALGVGMLVDNSIVVIENIYRMRSEGVPVRKAAVEGASQVFGAIVASTLTTCCVFLPIVFTEGITRQLFVDLGLTIAYALMASLIIAMTVVPSLSVIVLKNGVMKENKIFDRIQMAYSHSIDVLLKHKPLVLLTAVGLLTVSVWGAFQNGTGFMPAMESTQLTVNLTTEEDFTLEETAEVSDQVIETILQIPDVKAVGAMADSGSIMGMSVSGSSGNAVTMYVLLNEDQSMTNGEIKNQILEDTKDFPCELSVSTEMMDMSALGGSGISIQIQGKEIDTLERIAGDVAEILRNTEGTENVSDGLEETTPELRILVDRDKAMEYKQTVAQIYMVVAQKLAESSTSTTLYTESKDYPIIILDGEAEEFSVEDVKNLTISVTNKDGETEDIPLSDLAEFQETQSLSSINRINQNRTLTVSAAVTEGYNVGLVGNDVQKQLDQYSLPEGYSLKLAGENETINEAMVQMVKMLLLAVAFVYLVMVAQFQSLLSPFIIMFTIPLAFTGGFLGLIVFGMEVSVIAMIGFVMLTGVIVNNGIVMVDFINQLRRGGMAKREAIVEAGKTRLRPILMTALTTILGLMPMALGNDMGSDMAKPMAVVTIGGLIYGTFMTLWVVPCIYDIFNRNKDITEEEI